MAKSRIAVAYVLVLIAGQALAQSFPTKPLTLICPSVQGSTNDVYMRAFARIASKFLGQPALVENRPGESNTLGPAQMAASASPDGYTLAQLTINSFRLPHLQRVSWDPIRDFTYIIALSRHNFGVAVKADSQFATLRDLIEYAKANPEKATYGLSQRGGTAHVIMEDLGIKTGARFRRAQGPGPESARALLEGRILAIVTNIEWGPQIDSGAFRLLVTFGERRSRWNAPTAMELGFGIVAYSPFGIVGPKGMDPKIVKRLHAAFNRALDDPEYDELLTRLDMVDWYKSSEDYADWAIDQFEFQRKLIERTIGLYTN